MTSHALLSGGGEMRALVREHDWEATPLGPIETWPQSLRLALSICLGARAPIGIYWGEQLLLLYNDAFRQLIGDKHPRALGRPACEVFPEIWDTVGPMLAGVLATGVAVNSDGELLPLALGGRLEDRWFDFTANPIVGENGRVEGLLNIAVETTGRVLAERARLESERRLKEVVRAAGLSSDFRALFEAAPTPLLVLAPPDWTIVAANDARLEVTGTTREAVLGRELFDAYPDDPDDPQATGVQNLGASLERVLATRMTDVMAVQRYAVRDPSGRFVERWWSPMNTPVLGTDGEVALVIHRVEEVTDLVRLRGEAIASDQLTRDQQAVIDRLRITEAALRESETRFRLMADAVPQIVWVTDAEGRVEFFNKQWSDYTGVPYELTTAAEVAANHVHPEDAAATLAAFDEARRTGSTFSVEHRIRSKAGDYRWFLVRAEPHRDPGTAEVVRWFGASVDIHGRRQAETELREGEERFRQFAEASSDTLWIVDAVAGRLEYLSPAFEAMWGEPRDRVLADLSRWSEFVHPDDRAAAWAAMPRLLAGEAGTDEYRIVRPDGAVRWIEDTGFPIRDAQGRVARVGGVAQDQTERRAAAAALAESEARFRNMADHAPVMMWTTDPSGACTYLNCGWYEFTGQSEEEALGLGWLEVTHPDDRAEAERVFLEANAAQATFRLEYRLRCANSMYRWAIDAAAPRFGPGGEFLGYIGSVIDITERKEAEAALQQVNETLESRVAEAIAERERAEEALRQSQKMEAMGSLTGGVAHDFNNLLTPIIGSLDRLVTRGVGSERERRLMAGALEAAERAKTLVQRLLAFARRQPLQAVAVDVGTLVDGMKGLVGSTLGPKIDLCVDMAPDLRPAHADANQLEMALLNLAVNARDAMPEGGRLMIAATNESIRAPHSAGLGRGHYVRLSVADTGTGMDEATLARAVEPFFSTKGVGRGTGLGLSMVHGLAAQLGGGLTIDSRPGQGTAVALWLPISGAPVGEAEVGRTATGPVTSRGRALLVDDEDLVRMSTADMLMDLGFEVLEAGSAEDALALLQEGLTIDLLVTDHLMPGMSGADLAREARLSSPGLPVLIVSGYAEAEGVTPNLPRLVKPFRAAELAERLAALMPSSAPAQ